MKRVLVAMSGGVDSSLAALLLKNAGYECVGATMLLSGDETRNADDAREVCLRLGMEHRTFDMREAFRASVIEPFIRSYESGETPNPCVECNRHLKFDLMFERAAKLGCEYVATGHYAAIRERDGRYFLCRAADQSKDQSYFLYSLAEERLKKTLFPLGELTKSEVRALALEAGLSSAHRRDSQYICFIPDGDHADFISRYTKKSYPEGDFVDRDGRVLGRHRGLVRYTVGQRRGLGLSLPEPLYVAKKDAPNNRIVLCRDAELYGTCAELSDVTLSGFSGDMPTEFDAEVKVRYRHEPSRAHITLTGDGRAHVTFFEPQRAMTPGQFAVFYLGDIVLGGGKIVISC